MTNKSNIEVLDVTFPPFQDRLPLTVSDLSQSKGLVEDFSNSYTILQWRYLFAELVPKNLIVVNMALNTGELITVGNMHILSI